MAIPKRIMYSQYVDEWQITALKRVAARDGVPVSEQVRRAITRWLQTKDNPTRLKVEKNDPNGS